MKCTCIYLQWEGELRQKRRTEIAKSLKKCWTKISPYKIKNTKMPNYLSHGIKIHLSQKKKKKNNNLVMIEHICSTFWWRSESWLSIRWFCKHLRQPTYLHSLPANKQINVYLGIQKKLGTLSIDTKFLD